MWVSNSLCIEKAIRHLEEECGYDRGSGIVFIPYSTRANWISDYPMAHPTLEMSERGEVVVVAGMRKGVEAGPVADGDGDGDGDNGDDGSKRKKRRRDSAIPPPRKKMRRRSALGDDASLLPDPERDEQHIRHIRLSRLAY